MSNNRILRCFVLAVACGSILATSSRRATADSPRATISDVALGAGGTLEGVVIDAQGVPLSEVTVELRRSDQVVGQTTTDRLGRFKLRGVVGGVYHASAAGGHGVFRLWKAGTAPPTANDGVLLVCGSGYLRGQFAPTALLSSGLAFSGLVIATIAIPVTVSSLRLGS